MRWIASLILFVVVVTSSWAQKNPEIDFTQPILGMDGKPFRFADTCDEQRRCTPGDVMTLGDVCVVSLIAMIDADKNLDPMKKFERDQLSRKIFKNAHAELSPAELTQLKERVGVVQPTAVVGAVWPLLDWTLKSNPRMN